MTANKNKRKYGTRLMGNFQLSFKMMFQTFMQENNCKTIALLLFLLLIGPDYGGKTFVLGDTC